jgi:hypothetical protein
VEFSPSIVAFFAYCAHTLETYRERHSYQYLDKNKIDKMHCAAVDFPNKTRWRLFKSVHGFNLDPDSAPVTPTPPTKILHRRAAETS